MVRFVRIMKKLLYPNVKIIIASIPVSAVLLIYTFLLDREDSPIAYLSYVFSAYSLTIFCIWGQKNARSVKKRIESEIHKKPFVHRYLTDDLFKMHVSLYCSLVFNLIYAAIKLFSGIYYQSIWFGTLAVYYSILAMMRFLLLHHVNRNSIGKDIILELRQCRLCGVILLLMNIALSGVVVLVVRKNEGFAYAGYLIYVIAMYTFYNVITAVTELSKYRRYKSPVMSSVKVVKLASALVSILSLETAMLTQFDDRKDPAYRQLMTGITGGCVCLIVLGMAICIILRTTNQLKRLESIYT